MYTKQQNTTEVHIVCVYVSVLVDLSEMCCLDVWSVVSRLSRRCVLSQAPRVNVSQNLCVSVLVDLSESLEWVLCCLDVSSVVSSLSRCFVLSQAPRVNV